MARSQFLKYFVIAFLLLIFVAPTISMFYYSVHGSEGVDFSVYSKILSDDRQVALLERSLYISSIATLLALIWGVGMAYTIYNTRGILSRALELVSFLPLLLPSIVICMGWIYFAGQTGLINSFLKQLFGSDKSPINLYTPEGTAFIQSLCYFPCVSILVLQGFRGLNASQLKAAEICSGGSGMLRGVVLPTLSPFTVTGALFVFLLSMNDFGVPSALMVNVYPVEIFTQFGTYYNVREAIAFCVPPLLITLAVFAGRHLFFRSQPLESAGLAGTAVVKSKWLGSFCYPASVAIVVFSIIVPVIVLVITAGSFFKFTEALKTAGDQLVTSIIVSFLAVVIMVGACLLYSFAARDMDRYNRRISELFFLMLLVIPGSAVGLGILMLSRNNIWPISAISDTPWIIAYAASARFIVFPLLVLSSEVSSIREGIVWSSYSSGAGPLKTAKSIVLPLITPGIIASAILAFVFAMKELSAAVLISPPGYSTLAVRVESLLHFGEDAIVSALCLIMCAIVILLLALTWLLINRMVRIRL